MYLILIRQAVSHIHSYWQFHTIHARWWHYLKKIFNQFYLLHHK